MIEQPDRRRDEALGKLRLLVHLLDQDIRCLPPGTPNLEDVWLSMEKLQALVDLDDLL